ncbi:hypothetical protein S245_034997, partial [Arachis hypogaea]
QKTVALCPSKRLRSEKERKEKSKKKIKLRKKEGRIHREGYSAPTGAAEHRRQLQQSRQRHSQTRRRRSSRLHPQGHRRCHQQLCRILSYRVIWWCFSVMVDRSGSGSDNYG